MMTAAARRTRLFMRDAILLRRPAVWYCQGYTGNYEQWRQMGSFCTNANSDEDEADLRANCAILTAC